MATRAARSGASLSSAASRAGWVSAAMAETDGSEAGLLLEGLVLRLQADLRWLEACERHWTSRRDSS